MKVWEFDSYSFADQLKEMRKERGLKQEELAKLANVNITTIVNYENAYHVPTFPVVIKIAAIFGIDEIRISTKKKWVY